MVAVPLTDILPEKGSFIFGIEQKRAFQKFKDALTQAPVFTIFDPALSRRVLADTSGFASGAISEQLVNGNWHPIEYFSKRLSDVESHWSAIERKMLGCILVLERWRPYIIGQPFEIITDHASLQFFTLQPKLSRCQTHWLESLADFQPIFTFKRAKLQEAPDALSRILEIGQILQAVGKCHGMGGWVISRQHTELCDQALLEAVHQAQRNNINQECKNFYQVSNTGIFWGFLV